jgi:hypothetical protein
MSAMSPAKDGPDAAADKQRLARFRILDLSAVGLAFPIALLLGYFGGRVVGGWLGNVQLGGLIGALLGIAGGFYNLFKMVSRLAPSGGPAAGSAASGAGATGQIAAEPVEIEPDGADEDEEWLDLTDEDEVDDDGLDDDRPTRSE